MAALRHWANFPHTNNIPYLSTEEEEVEAGGPRDNPPYSEFVEFEYGFHWLGWSNENTNRDLMNTQRVGTPTIINSDARPGRFIIPKQRLLLYAT